MEIGPFVFRSDWESARLYAWPEIEANLFSGRYLLSSQLLLLRIMLHRPASVHGHYPTIRAGTALADLVSAHDANRRSALSQHRRFATHRWFGKSAHAGRTWTVPVWGMLPPEHQAQPLPVLLIVRSTRYVQWERKIRPAAEGVTDSSKSPQARRSRRFCFTKRKVATRAMI